MSELAKSYQIFNKPDLRKLILSLRREMSANCIDSKSNSLAKNFLNYLSSYDSINSVALYCPVNNEVDTKAIHDELIYQGKEILYPKIIDNKLVFIEFESFEDFTYGEFNILEPSGMKCRHPKLIDLFVVPSIAVGVKGKRLGYGGGFYDRALESVPKEKIWSIIYDFQHVYDFWGEDHDINVSMVFTNSKLLSIN